jgi:hypothetical protein
MTISMVNHYLQVGVDVDASSLAIKKKNILSSSLNGTLPFIQNNGDFNITTSLNSSTCNVWYKWWY